MYRLILICCLIFTFAPITSAQDLTFSTVSREPFSMTQDGQDVGFSVDLINAISADLKKIHRS